MKNIVSILLVVLLVLAVGCGNAEVAEDTQEMEEKEDLENTAEVMVKDDDVEVKVKVEDDLVKADTTVKTVEDVKKIHLISEEIYHKIAPYLKTE